MLPTLLTGRRMTSAGRQWLRVWGVIVAHEASRFLYRPAPLRPFRCLRRGMKATYANAV